jgi:hypothetical protein
VKRRLVYISKFSPLHYFLSQYLQMQLVAGMDAGVCAALFQRVLTCRLISLAVRSLSRAHLIELMKHPASDKNKRGVVFILRIHAARTTVSSGTLKYAIRISWMGRHCARDAIILMACACVLHWPLCCAHHNHHRLDLIVRTTSI